MNPRTPEIKVVVWHEDAEKEEEISVILRKWSGLKLLTLLGDIEEIGKLVGDDFSFDKSWTAPQVARFIHSLGETAVRRAANLILESVLKPKGLKVDDVLEWDLDALMQALTAIVEMNFGEGSRKNAVGLRDAFKKNILDAREALEKPDGKPESDAA